jgi:hypothetical protein
MTEDGWDSDRPRAHEARGLDRNEPYSKQKDADHATTRNHPLIRRIKDLEGVSTLHRGLGGYTRRVRSRAPTEKKLRRYDSSSLTNKPLGE